MLERHKKELFYKSNPELSKINSELNNYAIQISKATLENNKSEINRLKKEFEELKNKKEKILNNLNLPEDFFSPFYDCKICNDTGYIVDEKNKSVLCNCIKQKLFNIAIEISDTDFYR
jgi:DNA replication protein DnaC